MSLNLEKQTAEFRDMFKKVRAEIQKVMVGQGEIIDGVLTAVFCSGNVLLEGVPGLGKTMLVRTLAQAMDLQFSRIQFTPDLMPADIVGTNVVVEEEGGRGRTIKFMSGPVFAQIVLADEINRATPKTQSALLEVMQEHTVTASGKQYRMEEPFFVLATQNPLEMEGTYPLPEAQLDRFMFKLLVRYSNRAELTEVLTRTTEGKNFECNKVIDGKTILAGRQLVREVLMAPHLKDFAVRIVMGTHPGGELGTDAANKFIRFGASPRAAQALVLAGKVQALLDGRYHISHEDILAMAPAVLRHRLILNFEAEAEGIQTDDIVAKVLAAVPKTLD
ncbi:MAG TPA: MoxR family ATPase [Planctomycetota bacterium]|nr:MoxR family ATPase [Planctomycetota bacterium]